MSGWIKLHRELLDKAIWTESTPEQKTILITLLMMANHQEKEWEWKGERYAAKPGQFVTSLQKIQEKCGSGVSIQNIRTALKRFEKYNFLTDESTNKNRLITIVNWGFYQKKDDEVTDNITGNQQAPNKQLTPNKNDKNDKNERIKNIYSHWNSLKITVHREMTKSMQSKINARLVDRTEDEIKEAISNYDKIYKNDDFWFTYKFTLDRFMSPETLDKFLTQNDPFTNFAKRKGNVTRVEFGRSDEEYRRQLDALSL